MKGFRRMPMMILSKEAGIIVKFARSQDDQHDGRLTAKEVRFSRAKYRNRG